jgi:uncharacterized membrane protein YfcA
MELVVFGLIVAVASYFQGITGFGQGLVAAPLAFVLFDKHTALTILVTIGVIGYGYLVIRSKEPLEIRTFRPLLIARFFGMLLGLIIARMASLPLLQVVAGSLSMIFVVILTFGRFRLNKRQSYSIFAGLLSGIMQTSTTLSGPPVVLVLSAQHTPKNVIRRLLPAYFLVLMIITLVLFCLSGLFSMKGLMLGFVVSPLVLLGAYLGKNHGDIMSPKHYRLLTMVAVFATGMVAVYNGLGN